MAEQRVYSIEEKRLSPITEERISEILESVKNIQFHNLWRRGYSETLNLIDGKLLGESIDTVCGTCLDFIALNGENHKLANSLRSQNETVDMLLFIIHKYKINLNEEIELIRKKEEEEEKRKRENTGTCEKTSVQS